MALVLVEMLHNVSLVVLAGLAYGALLRSVGRRRLFQAGLGLVFGAITFLVTFNHVVTPTGATLDGRAGPVLFAAYVGGPVSAVLTCGLGIGARMALGGPFVFTGALSFFVYGLIGLGLNRWEGKKLDHPIGLGSTARLAALSVLGAGLMYLLMDEPLRAQLWLERNFSLIAAANVLSCFVLGFTMRRAGLARQTALALEQTAERVALASGSAGIGFWEMDIADQRIRWNDAQHRLYGLQPDSFEGSIEAWHQRVHPDDLDYANEQAKRLLKDKGSYDIEFRIILPEGETKNIRSHARVVRDLDGDPLRYVGVNYDVTELRQSERALRENQVLLVQAQKMEAVGRLSGGLAHDFNNLLSVVIGNLELAPDAKDKNELLHDALTAARRGARLTEQLLAFGRRAPLRPSVLEPQKVFEDMERLLRPTLPSNVETTFDATRTTRRVELDESQLESVLLNLAINARDAMPEGGRLTLQAVDVDRSFGEEGPEPFVRISVQDDGEGMPDEVQALAFDPFFTTKEVGKGSGMGLAMVHGFVQQSKGRIELSSEPGCGTRINLFFPAAEKTASAEAPKLELPSGGSERLLLVEDDEDVRRTLARQLETLGYNISAAADGEEALEFLAARPGVIDLVIADVMMPRMGGQEFGFEVRGRWPKLPIVFVSGYFEGDIDSLELRTFDARLQKPVDLDAFASAIRRSLNAAPRTEVDEQASASAP